MLASLGYGISAWSGRVEEGKHTFERDIIYLRPIYISSRSPKVGAILETTRKPLATYTMGRDWAAHLYEAHVKRVLASSSPSHAAHGLSLGESIQTQDLEERSTDGSAEHRTAATDSVPMVMMAVVTVSIRYRRRNEVAIRTNEPAAHLVGRAILHCSPCTRTGADHARLTHGARLITQRLTASSAHESVSTQIRYFERRHLACDLPEMRDCEDGRPG